MKELANALAFTTLNFPELVTHLKVRWLLLFPDAKVVGLIGPFLCFCLGKYFVLWLAHFSHPTSILALNSALPHVFNLSTV